MCVGFLQTIQINARKTILNFEWELNSPWCEKPTTVTF
jgi:hypothetical protein